MKEKIKAKLKESNFKERMVTEYRFRTIFFTVLGMLGNIILAVINIVSAAVVGSAWMGSLAAYYILLSCMRGKTMWSAWQISKLHDKQERLKREQWVYTLNSLLMIVMGIVLGGITFVLWESQGGKTYPGVMIYAVAAYTFFRVVFGIIKLAKSTKHESPLLTIIRKISYVDACVSLISLETAMMASFGADTGETFIRMMNTSTGVLIMLMTIAVGAQGLSRNAVVKHRTKVLTQEDEYVVTEELLFEENGFPEQDDEERADD